MVGDTKRYEHIYISMQNSFLCLLIFDELLQTTICWEYKDEYIWGDNFPVVKQYTCICKYTPIINPGILLFFDLIEYYYLLHQYALFNKER